MPRPRAGDWLEDEVASWRKSGLEVIVSLLEESEIVELGLQAEEKACTQAGMKFLSCATPDRGLPASQNTVSALVEELINELQQGRGVGIHCRIGVGRSALLAACVLHRLGCPLDEAWGSIARARGLSVPDTVEQREWVARWARSSEG